MNSEVGGMKVDKFAFFKGEISDMLDSENKNDFPIGLRERLEIFVRDCAGAADSEMDISFQENGRGYYAHLQELVRLKGASEEDYSRYRDQLLSELKEAEDNDEMTHQMKVVYDELSREKG